MSYTILSLVLCLSATVSSSVRGTRTYREEGGSNHKIVNEIYWRTWVYNIFEFSPADSLALYQIAEQKPHIGGTAVYDARVMLGLDFFDYEDDQNKMASGFTNEDPLISFEDVPNFVLYPNPASSNINYKILLSDLETARLTFFDVTGRLILNKK